MIAESKRTLANDSKESAHWESVLNENRFSIPIPTQESMPVDTSSIPTTSHTLAIVTSAQHGGVPRGSSSSARKGLLYIIEMYSSYNVELSY